jgi:hypothetical protein
MDLRGRRCLAHLARGISGEPVHSPALLSATAACLTTPHVAVPPPRVGGAGGGERIVASLPPGGRRWGAQREVLPGDAPQAGKADHLFAHDPPELEGPDRTSRARQGGLGVCLLGSAPACLEARGPDLLVDAGVEAVHQAPLGRRGRLVAPAAAPPREGRHGGHFSGAGLAGERVHGLPHALEGLGWHA